MRSPTQDFIQHHGWRELKWLFGCQDWPPWGRMDASIVPTTFDTTDPQWPQFQGQYKEQTYTSSGFEYFEQRHKREGIWRQMGISSFSYRKVELPWKIHPWHFVICCPSVRSTVHMSKTLSCRGHSTHWQVFDWNQGQRHHSGSYAWLFWLLHGCWFLWHLEPRQGWGRFMYVQVMHWMSDCVAIKASNQNCPEHNRSRICCFVVCLEGGHLPDGIRRCWVLRVLSGGSIFYKIWVCQYKMPYLLVHSVINILDL